MLGFVPGIRNSASGTKEAWVSLNAVIVSRYMSLVLFLDRSNVKNRNLSWEVVVHVFNPSTWEVSVRISVSLRPAWSTE